MNINSVSIVNYRGMVKPAQVENGVKHLIDSGISTAPVEAAKMAEAKAVDAIYFPYCALIGERCEEVAKKSAEESEKELAEIYYPFGAPSGI